MDNVGSMAKLISDYGILIVIAAMFLLAVYANIKRQQKHYEELQQSQMESEKRLLDTVLNQNKILMENIDKTDNRPPYNEKTIVEIFVKLNNLFKTECRLTSEKTHSDRTAIYVFHNGTQSSHGLPFFKMSCICEWINRSSISNSKMQEHTNMTLNLFDDIVTNIQENGEYMIDKKTEEIPSNLLYIKGTKTVKAIFLAILDDNNQVLGYIENDYNKDSALNIEEIKYEMQLLGDKTRPTLQFSDYQNKTIKE